MRTVMKLFWLLLATSAAAKRLGSTTDERLLQGKFLDWGDNNGIGDAFGGIDWGMDWVNTDWTNFDWNQIDWSNFDFDNFDWGNFGGWGNGTWDDVFGNFDVPDLDTCTFLESVVGMGQAFVIAGGCTCDGEITQGMNISCFFENECVDGSGVCGSVSLNNTVGDIAGSMSTSACVDFTNDEYSETCFTYSFDVADLTGMQSCSASYGGNSCSCEIDNFCLSIDCSMYLPGAKMDTCREILMQAETDAVTFMPDFQIFDQNFAGFEFGDIDFSIIDWDNFDWENFDFSMVEWGDAGWGDLFGDLDSLDVCPILETAIDMGAAFGIAANCSCEGALTTGMNISCDFDQCVEGTDICGSIGLDFPFDNLGSVSAGACVDFANDDYLETCFTYEIPMADLSTQTCTASYGGNACDCDIEDFCLKLDCSAYLPGAKMDTCQYIQIEEGNGTATFVPSLEIFRRDFEGFNFENIDWEVIDWENLDWSNFDFDKVNWDSTDWANTDWGEIIGVEVDGSIICPVLERVIGMSEEFGIEGSCTCGSSVDGGFDMDCSFAEVCADDSLCGSIGLTFGFDNVGSVEGKVCADFPDGEYLETCFSYFVPIADQVSTPECSATYGGSLCSCEIDENFCVSIDCSDHEPSAVTDSCQVISMENSEVNSFLPRFLLQESTADVSGSEESETGAENGATDSDESESETTEGGDEATGQDSNLSEANENGDESGASFARLGATAITMMSILLLSL